MRLFRSILLAATGTLALTACAVAPNSSKPELALAENPEQELKTTSLDELQSLPPAARKVVVAVYRFDDLTGQNKPNDSFSEYSRAVTVHRDRDQATAGRGMCRIPLRARARTEAM
jgi:curli production assembly/transport component CsgG